MFRRQKLEALVVVIVLISARFPALAGDVDLVTEGATVETVLSDGLPNETGRWQTKVQQVFDPKSQKVERRVYDYFDPTPARQLDIVWYPQDRLADKSGHITGVGRLVWRERNRAAWDSAGIVRVFDGEMHDGRPNGKGSEITSDGRVYDGAWQNGRPHGSGRLKLPNGEEYLGEFKNGLAEGKGRKFEITGEVFEGEFRKGLRNGEGKTKLPSGFSYESKWVNGVEAAWSRRIRLAQVGGPSQLGGGDDVRMGVTIQEKPHLPPEVELNEVITYRSSNNGQIKVQPADAELMAAWKGNGEMQTFPGRSTIHQGIFNFNSGFVDSTPPTFLLEFQNRSAIAINVQSLRLDVAESSTDNQPAVQLMDDTDPSCAEAFHTQYTLENFGWSPAKAGRMRISFGGGQPTTPDVNKAIGDLPGRQVVNLEHELDQLHVMVARLKELSMPGFPCPSGSLRACLETLRSNQLFGTLGPKLELNASQIVVPASGLYDYQWRDNKGVDHGRTSPFKVKVSLGKFVETAECGEGASPEPISVTSVKLRLDATNYSLPIAFQRRILAGAMARFSLPIDAAKSSSHAFRIVAKLADGREISSLPIDMLYYRPNPPPPVR
jgi:hypothetical protein